VPFATAISIGDLLILIGMIVLVVSGDRSPWTRIGSLREPLRVAPFRRLIGGRAISDVGDLLAMTAVVTWLFEREHSVALVSAFLIVRILASSAGGLAAASLLDRLPYFRTLAIVEIGRAVLTAGILAAAVTGQLAAVFMLVCVSAAVGSATSPSAASLVPELLPAELVPAGNGLHGVASNCAFILGAALGSVSVRVLGIGPALAFDLTSFVLAAALYRSFAHVHDEEEPAKHASTELPAPRREILRVLVSDGVLFGLTASFTVVTAAMGLLNASLPGFLSQHLSEPAAYGYGLAAIAAGLFCGELLASLLPDGRIARRSVALAFAGSAAILYTVSTTSVAATVYLLLFLLGCADGTTEVVRDSLFQRHLEPRLRAGGFAVANALQRLGMACGFAAAPLVALLAGTAAGVRVSAAACLAGALIAGLLLVVRFSRRPATLDSATLAEPV
jgi:predicted MFS family arabinose efflux permease